MKKIREDYRPISELHLITGKIIESGLGSIRPYWDEGHFWFALLDRDEKILGRVPESAVLYVWYGN